MSGDLYAWKNTAFQNAINLIRRVIPNIKTVDHTWVTTYADGAENDDRTLGSYWYCYGGLHSRKQLCAEGKGGEDFAKSIATPHDPTSRVGIVYIKQGVCHQMANRLLRFSGDGQKVTVSNAKGYKATIRMWGEYGGKVSERKRLFYNITESECEKRFREQIEAYEQETGIA